MIKRGRFIVWEGSDFAGKSTQMGIAVQESRERGIPTLATREPGGSSIGPQIRQLLLNPDGEELHAKTELSLLLSDRIQAWYGKTALALNDGVDVHSDRSWYSSIPYQGFAGGLGADFVIEMHEKFLPPEYLYPDLALDLALTEEQSAERKALRENQEFGTHDRIEQKDATYYANVKAGYAYVRQNMGMVCVNAYGTRQEVAARWRPYVFPEG